jgi:very-short-patch-repair endonuclease
MGITHANRITDALRRARVEDPELNEFCEQHPEEPVFIKNLERVQGDERDAVILSVGYGKGPDGRMLYRFGPINNEGGERRLNVAVTRARSKMTVVSSFMPHELDPAKLRSEGAKMLGRYLEYAASGGTDLGTVAVVHPPLNSFEIDVRKRLTEVGVPLVAQLGVSGYFIDFAAQHPRRPGQYVLAIEADGASYHASATARERDRLRQEHLERLGWRFHRIWSTDWFRNPEVEVAKAHAAWEAAVAISDRYGEAGENPVTETPHGWAPPTATSERHDAPSTTPPARTGRRPLIYANGSISDYSADHLLEIVTWVASDGLLRTNTELLEAVISEMRFERKGKRIVEAVNNAIWRHGLRKGR